MSKGYPEEYQKLGLDSEKLDQVLIDALKVKINEPPNPFQSPFFSGDEGESELIAAKNQIDRAKSISPSISVYCAQKENGVLLINSNLEVISKGQAFLAGQKIIPETLSRFTGYFDFYGVPIFTGDTVAVLETTSVDFAHQNGESDSSFFENYGVPKALHPHLKTLKQRDLGKGIDLEGIYIIYQEVSRFDTVLDSIGFHWLKKEKEGFVWESDNLAPSCETVVVKRRAYVDGRCKKGN